MARERTGMAVVMFTDRAGSTAARTSLGDTAADALERHHDELLEQAVTRCGGAIVKWLGDGVLVTFEAASAAVAAAVEVQRSVARYNRRSNRLGTLAVRVGLSAGDVVWEDGDLRGTPVVEAARLEAAAPPGTIYCSEIVRMLAGSRTDVAMRPVGPLELKGLAGSLLACEVVWEDHAEGEGPPLPEALVREERLPMVGRAGEREALLALWQRSAEGELVAALIAGEPGAGKTRLSREVAREVHARGALVLYGRCDEDLGVPYQPFAEALRFHLRRGGATPDQLGRFPAELALVAPEVVDIVPSAGSAARHEDETQRYRLFEAMLSWLEAAAAERPVLLFLDDLHWADPPTLHLLRYIVRARSFAHVMVVGTYRDVATSTTGELAEFLRAAWREPGVVRIELGGLEVDDICALLDGPGPVVEAAGVIHEQTGGNAYFVGEVVHQLRATAGSAAALEVPRTVQDVVYGRLERLPPLAAECLEAMTVAGAEVEAALIADALGRPDAEVAEGLEAACADRLLRELPDPPLRFRFQHAIVRTTLYGRIPARRRGHLHHLLGSSLERRSGDSIDAQLEDLALHFSRSSEPGDGAKLVRYGTEAGDRAMRQLAYDQAVAFYRLAVDAAERPGGGVDERARCEGLLRLGVAQRRAHAPAARDSLVDAADRAFAIGADDLVVEAAVANSRTVFWAGDATDARRAFVVERALVLLGDDDGVARAKLLANLSVERYLAGDDADHRRLADEALAVARRTGDAAALAFVLHYRHLTMWRPDNAAERLALAVEMRDAVRKGDALSRFELGVWALPGFNAALELGDLDFAAASLAELSGLALELRHVNFAYNLRLVQALWATVAGRLDEAERLADEMLDLGKAAGQRTAPVFHLGLLHTLRYAQGRLGERLDVSQFFDDLLPQIPLVRIGRCMGLAESGHLDEAREMFRPFVETRFSRLPFDRDWLVAVCTAVRVAADLCDAEAAAILRDLLAPFSGQCVHNGTGWWGRVEGYRGLAAAVAGDDAQADADFAAAVAGHRTLGAPVSLCFSLVDWGTALVERGDVGASRPLLDEGASLAARHGLARLHERALAGLAGTGQRARTDG